MAQPKRTGKASMAQLALLVVVALFLRSSNAGIVPISFTVINDTTPTDPTLTVDTNATLPLDLTDPSNNNLSNPTDIPNPTTAQTVANVTVTPSPTNSISSLPLNTTITQVTQNATISPTVIHPSYLLLNGNFQTDVLTSSALLVGQISYWNPAQQGILQLGSNVSPNWKTQVLSLYSNYVTVPVRLGKSNKVVNQSTLSNGQISKNVVLSGQKITLSLQYSGSELFTGALNTLAAQAFERTSDKPQVRLIVSWNGKSRLVSAQLRDRIYTFSEDFPSVKGVNVLILSSTTSRSDANVVGTMTIDNVTVQYEKKVEEEESEKDSDN